MASSNGGTISLNAASTTVRCRPGLDTQVSRTLSSPGDPTPLTDLATLTEADTLGDVEGTVSFFLCGPTDAPADCADGGAPVGGPVALTQAGASTATAASPDVRSLTTADGWYCFRAEFAPAEGSDYLPIVHADAANECFQHCSLALTIAKAVPGGGTSATIDAGSDIVFTVTVTNDGEGIARNVAITDPLPGRAVLDWTIQGTAPAECAIVGKPANDTLGCAGAGEGIQLGPDESLTVSVAATTTVDTCGTFANTAVATADNAAEADAGATTTVRCPPGLDTQVSRTTLNEGDTAPLTDTATVTAKGDLGPPEGSVEFRLCGPTAAPADCTAGTLVGEVALDGNGTATSPDVTDLADEPGFYCFRAVFVPSNDLYLGTEHVAAENECFQRAADEPLPTQTPVPTATATPVPTAPAPATTAPPPAPAGPDCNHTATFDVRAVTLETAIGNDKIFSGEVVLQELGQRVLGCFIRLSFDGTLQDILVTDDTTTVSEPVAVSGSFTGYYEPLGVAGIRAFQTAQTFELVLTAVESWNVPGVVAPTPVTAVVTITGPVVSVQAVGVTATVRVEPQLALPLVASGSFVVTDVDVVPAELPGTGAGPQDGGRAFGPLMTAALGVLALLALAIAIRHHLRPRAVGARRPGGS